MSSGPLAGVRVVEIAVGGSSPLAGMLFSDMGAEVIRVERIGSERRELGPRAALRGRTSILLDLNQPVAVDVVHRLCGVSDALVEGFRPGTAERMGIGPDACLERNPALVYGRLTGWGQVGAGIRQRGHDLNFLALGGALFGSTGATSAAMPADRPLTSMADRGGPALLFAYGMVCGLFEARSSGRGQVIDCAAVDAPLLLGAKFGTGTSAQRLPPSHVGAPFYNVYEAADGRNFAVAAVEPPTYRELLSGLGLPADDFPDQHDRTSWDLVRERIAAAFRSRDSDYWNDAFATREAQVTPVLSPAQGRGEARLRAGRAYLEVDGDWQPAPAPLFSRTPAGVPEAAVPAGHDSREVLDRLGYTSADAERLIGCGAVGLAPADSTMRNADPLC